MSQLDRDPCVAAAVGHTRGGSRAGLAFLYVGYRATVRGYIQTIVREQHVADELTLQTFLRLRSAIGEYEPRRAPFSAWLLRLARAVAVEHLQDRRLLDWERVYERSRPFDSAGGPPDIAEDRQLLKLWSGSAG
jgi:DNA-directed RNA polymerase specialized sigma24 family protein